MQPSMTIPNRPLDLQLLPETARQELFDFYEFLVFKYQRDGRSMEGDASIETPSQSSESKWAKLVQRVVNDPVHLNGYAEILKHDFQEFREQFEFIHDRQP